MVTTKDIKSQFLALSGEEQEQILAELTLDFENRGQIIENAQKELSEKKYRKPCPHCSSAKVHKMGSQGGVQMYKCLGCKKWYSDTTGTPLWDIKLKHKWQAYLRCMQEKKSIAKTAVEVGICVQTAFDWRHKILSSLSKFIPETLGNTVECDEMEIPIKQKGSRVKLGRKARKRSSDFKRNTTETPLPTVVQVVTVVERQGERFLKVVESKRLTTDEIQETLADKLKEETILITDKHPSFRSFAKKQPKLKHRTVLSTDHVNKSDKSIHLQTVNNTHSQIRGFLRPFNGGVSSKYLQNYLNWYAYEGKLAGTLSTIKQWVMLSLTSPTAYQLYCQFKENTVNIRI
jgi:transposase-like protein